MPLRDCKKVRSKTPIAYYNTKLHQIYIDVQEIDHLAANITGQGNPVGFISYSHVMKGFQGGFQIAKRSSQNEIIPSPFESGGLLVQISESLSLQATFAAFGSPPRDTSREFAYSNNDGVFAGIVARRYNGASSALDIQVANSGQFNAFALLVSPFLTLPSCCSNNGNQFESGDNPNTPVREFLSTPSKFIYFDNPRWATLSFNLTKDFLTNPLIPEDFSNFPEAKPSTVTELARIVNGHEYIHNMQQGTGIIGLLDLEAQATGIEMDAELNQGNIIGFRPFEYTRICLNAFKGL